MGETHPNVPSRGSRVAAGLLGGAVALGVTVGLAVAQAGGSPQRPAAAGAAPRAATAPAARASSSASSGSTPAAAHPAGSVVSASSTSSPESAAQVSALAAGGIPATALAAYRDAGAAEAVTDPQCRLPWALLAGIGRVESDHGRFGGSVLHADGVSTPRIIGIPLNGHGTEVVRDTDRGRLDGDTTYDRAVGPMQFIPSTWATWGRDGNRDGVRDPFNIYDAARASADYLCAAGGDLGTAAGQQNAVLTYNHSDAYLHEVLGLEQAYARQFGVRIPKLPAHLGIPAAPKLPPADPAARRADTAATTSGGSSVPGTPRTTAPSTSTPRTTSRPSTAPSAPSTSRSTTPGCPTATGTPAGTPTAPSTPAGTPTPSGSSSSTSPTCPTATTSTTTTTGHAKARPASVDPTPSTSAG